MHTRACSKQRQLLCRGKGGAQPITSGQKVLITSTHSQLEAHCPFLSVCIIQIAQKVIRTYRSLQDQLSAPSLLDHQLQLPLQHIVTLLSPDAVGRLACTCKSLRDLVYSNLLDQAWWTRVAAARLGTQHPVLIAEDQPGPSILRAAMSQCARASAGIVAGKYLQSATLLLLWHAFWS